MHCRMHQSALRIICTTKQYALCITNYLAALLYTQNGIINSLLNFYVMHYNYKVHTP